MTDVCFGLLQVLEFMHKNHIVHRDVKPDNFCLPRGADALQATPLEKVYIVDMGMAQQYSAAGEMRAAGLAPST
jgi:serine/threonine protein kinase